MLTYEELKKNKSVKAYITGADRSLAALGFTEHSFAHVTKVAATCESILSALGYSEHEIELAKIAAYLHDIGSSYTCRQIGCTPQPCKEPRQNYLRYP